jgi:hypothetical protein
LTGDADGDGDVNGADFLRWQRGLGTTLAATSTSAPEPATWALASWLSLATAALRVRRHSAR